MGSLLKAKGFCAMDDWFKNDLAYGADSPEYNLLDGQATAMPAVA